MDREDYERWGPYNSGKPPVPEPMRFGGGNGELGAGAVLGYLGAMFVIGINFFPWAASIGLPSWGAWACFLAAAAVLLSVWAVVWGLVVGAACIVVIYHSAIMIARLF